MPEWDAEVVVGRALARRLIASQFPSVELGSLRLLAQGWDNTVWLADGRWAFRFPRRAIAIPGVRREIALLPRLAPRLPVAVPVPEHVGRPDERFPWPFYGAALVPGREPADAGLRDEARSALARPLGELLRALHAPGLAESVDPQGALPPDPMGRGDMAMRAPLARDRLGELERLGLWREGGRLRRVLAEARELGPAEATVLAHGDLHVRHVLVDGGGALAGVIDWGDVCRADPAIDLSLLWSLLEPEARPALLAAYGRVPPEGLLRARVLALFLCATLALYAHHEGMGALRREALDGLERTAAG